METSIRPNLSVILTTCSTEAEATKLASALVESSLAACVSIIPGCKSIYHWQGKIEQSNEQLLLIKTTTEREEDLRMKLTEIHPYDNPEYILLSPQAVAEEYLNWVNSSTGVDQQSQ